VPQQPNGTAVPPHDHKRRIQPMPNDRHISLDVRDKASKGSDGYTTTIASDGTTYSYKYSELDDDGNEHIGGNVVFDERGPVTVKVKVTPKPRYRIDYVSFANNINHQLSWTHRSKHFEADIQNDNGKTQSAYYKVTVKDTQENCTIACDPMIINR
jgi:hypothetical protein